MRRFYTPCFFPYTIYLINGEGNLEAGLSLMAYDFSRYFPMDKKCKIRKKNSNKALNFSDIIHLDHSSTSSLVVLIVHLQRKKSRFPSNREASGGSETPVSGTSSNI